MDAVAFERVREVLARSPRVQLAYLFGSVARGDDGASSDLDVAVMLSPPGASPPGARAGMDLLQEELEDEAGRIVDLDRAPPLLLHEVLREGRVLAARSEDVLAGEFAETVEDGHGSDAHHMCA